MKFVLKVNGLQTLANGSTTPGRKWVVSWNYPTATSDGGQYYVAMISDATGVVTFEYGTITTQVVGLLIGVPTANMIGYADPTSNFASDGTITIVVPKAQVGNPAAGDIMGSIAAKSYADPTNNLRSTLVLDSNSNGTNNDREANAAMYTLVGNGCSTTTTTTSTNGSKITNKTSSAQTDFAPMLSGVQVVSF